jgi:hypothetical protein
MAAKDHFFKACLLYMVNDDMPGAKKCFDNASFEDPSFDNSRQQKFLEGIMTAIEAVDNAMYSSIVGNHVNMTPFDKVNNKLVVTIKTKYCPEKKTI